MSSRKTVTTTGRNKNLRHELPHSGSTNWIVIKIYGRQESVGCTCLVKFLFQERGERMHQVQNK
jgi:hypothetical protein